MGSVRFPDVPRLGLGVGLDLPWGAEIGIVREEGRDVVGTRVTRFLRRHAADFGYLFVSWQAQGRGVPRADHYRDVYDDLFARVPSYPVRALHQTALNLGATEAYDLDAVCAFTNDLVCQHGFSWVNEDLGLWSLRGRNLPYPLPPYLTPAGLEAAIHNTDRAQARLDVPLLVEFPGFTEGTGFYVGRLDAYDFFREVVEQTASPCTLDTGHLLSWRWLQGHRGEALFEGIDRLPLDHCFEIHLSGCAVAGGRFRDLHHGVLMDEQLEFLERLMERCPALHAITYEDPKFDERGVLIDKARPGFERLLELTRDFAPTVREVA